jgi:hypothetical protein
MALNLRFGGCNTLGETSGKPARRDGRLVARGVCVALLAIVVAIGQLVLAGYVASAVELGPRGARQPQLLKTALASLKPGRPGVTDLYFVGFGADSLQDVFRKEVQTIRALFDERFDTLGRSVALVNNARTLDQLPVATMNNLGAVLRRIGRLMNVDEDILFLYLTGHGANAKGLSVRLWPLEPCELDAAGLRTLLDEAHIKWRVIVISACYSGSFIAPLRGDTTLVATAAAADRTSFGCECGNDFTYFGRAYFHEALRETRSFLAAFDRARAAVLRREEAERRLPSCPQLSVGGAIRAKLKQLERRLALEHHGMAASDNRK